MNLLALSDAQHSPMSAALARYSVKRFDDCGRQVRFDQGVEPMTLRLIPRWVWVTRVEQVFAMGSGEYNIETPEVYPHPFRDEIVVTSGLERATVDFTTIDAIWRGGTPPEPVEILRGCHRRGP